MVQPMQTGSSASAVKTDYFTPVEPAQLPPPRPDDPAVPWEEPVDTADLGLAAPRNRWWKPALLGAVAALVAIGGYEAVQVVVALDRLHPLAGIAAALLFTAALGLAGAAAWRGRGMLADHRRVRALRERARVLRDSRRRGGFADLARELRTFYDGKPQLPALEAALADTAADWEDGEALQHLETRFLAPLDRQAEVRVRQVAVQSGTLVAFSPWVLMDMVLVLWRALRLLDDVGRIYGIRGSALGRWALLRRVLGTMAAAGASEMVLDQLVERSSNRLLAGLSGAAAQGLGCGLYTARLGWVAQQVVRPVPAADRERRRLAELYRLLRQQLLGRLQSDGTNGGGRKGSE